MLHTPTFSHHCESASGHKTGWHVEMWSHRGHIYNSPLLPPCWSPVSSYGAALVQELTLHPTLPVSLLCATHCQSPAQKFLLFNIYTTVTKSRTGCFCKTVSTTVFVFGRCKVQILVPTLVILIEGLMVFLSPSRNLLGCYLNTGHDHFLPHPFQFDVHSHSTIWHHTIYAFDKIVLKNKKKYLIEHFFHIGTIWFFVIFCSFMSFRSLTKLVTPMNHHHELQIRKW